MQRALDIRAVVEIQEGEHWRRLDLEEKHEEEEYDSAMYPTGAGLGDLCEEEQGRMKLCRCKNESEQDRGQHHLGTCLSASPRVMRSKINRGRREASCPRASGPPTVSTAQHSLCRLTEYREKGNDISSALAWDDLTGMRLDAGKVREARSKEVQYIWDKRVYDNNPRQQALRKGVDDH